jgi:phosphatidylserine/phosphatidylglycerophosphate/cardiolipin synthase-like enzyme
LEKIKNAKKNIYIEVYLFTHKNIRNAVLMAKKRWIEIKIILEKNIYKSANLNLKTFLEFKKNNIDVIWSNPKNYKLNHSKILIIDNELILSTGNLSYSTFTKNTDFFIFTKNINLVEKFKKIFLWDFIWEKTNIYDHNIILSPNYSKEKFDKLFIQTKKSLKMYIPYLWNKFAKKILDLKKKNIDIKIIFSDRENNIEKINLLKNYWIKIQTKKNIHSKAFLIDNKILYIWSTNFDSNSIEKNREAGLLIKNYRAINYFLKYFNKDFTGK